MLLRQGDTALLISVKEHMIATITIIKLLLLERPLLCHTPQVDFVAYWTFCDTFIVSTPSLRFFDQS